MLLRVVVITDSTLTHSSTYYQLQSRSIPLEITLDQDDRMRYNINNLTARVSTELEQKLGRSLGLYTTVTSITVFKVEEPSPLLPTDPRLVRPAGLTATSVIRTIRCARLMERSGRTITDLFGAVADLQSVGCEDGGVHVVAVCGLGASIREDQRSPSGVVDMFPQGDEFGIYTAHSASLPPTYSTAGGGTTSDSSSALPIFAAPAVPIRSRGSLLRRFFPGSSSSSSSSESHGLASPTSPHPPSSSALLSSSSPQHPITNTPSTSSSSSPTSSNQQQPPRSNILKNSTTTSSSSPSTTILPPSSSSSSLTTTHTSNNSAPLSPNTIRARNTRRQQELQDALYAAHLQSMEDDTIVDAAVILNTNTNSTSTSQPPPPSVTTITTTTTRPNSSRPNSHAPDSNSIELVDVRPTNSSMNLLALSTTPSSSAPSTTPSRLLYAGREEQAKKTLILNLFSLMKKKTRGTTSGTAGESEVSPEGIIIVEEDYDPASPTEGDEGTGGRKESFPAIWLWVLFLVILSCVAVAVSVVVLVK